jgi:hypothetical protein
MTATVLLFLAIDLGNFYQSDSLHLPDNHTTNVFKSLRIYYTDSKTNSKSVKYRELTEVTDEYFSKPAVIDIKILLKEIPEDGMIQVYIEELQDPTNVVSDAYETRRIKNPTWVMHEVVFSNLSKNLKSNELVIKDVHYKTAYYYTSILYIREAFRVIAVFKPKNSSSLQSIKK